MSNLPEADGTVYATVRQIENGEAQGGGAGGLWNEHALAMIARTNWLKKRCEEIVATGYQAGSAMLSALSGLSTVGMIVRTAAGAAVARVLTAGTGVTVANGDGVAGNPTVSVSLGGFAVVLAANGMLRLPSWLGGVQFSWGVVASNATSLWPYAFPAACLTCLATENDETVDTLAVTAFTATNVTLSSSEGMGIARFIAIGY